MVTDKEKSLSDKRERWQSAYKYSEEDVKEAVKQLKEDISIDPTLSNDDVNGIFEYIKNRFGDKLNGN